MKKIILFMIPLAFALSCQPKAGKVAAIDLADLDTTVAPGQDFFKYANGGWIASHPLPAEFSRFGTFDQLGENNVVRVNELFKTMTQKTYAQGSVEQKISDLYKLGLDSLRLNSEGAAPVHDKGNEVFAIDNLPEMFKYIASLHDEGIGVFFDCSVSADMTDSDSQILYLSQSGLGMGDREYYVNPKNAKFHEGYRDMILKLFEMCSLSAQGDRASGNALQMEDYLAEISWSREQNRDVLKMYNPMSTAQLKEEFPGIDWDAYFQARNIPEQEKIIVCQPSYFKGLSDFFLKAADCEADLYDPMSNIRGYICASIARDAAPFMSDDIYQAYFDFFSTQMRGITEMKPRWKRAMSIPNSVLGEAVGKMYVAKYFPPEYKEKALKLVENLRTSLGEHIDALSWMSDSTKLYAKEKLGKFSVKIGYPDKWKDYSALEIDPEQTYYQNIVNASRWAVADNMADLGKPTDRSRWYMSPQTVNAYYDPSQNEICFPAAILQAPFFNPDADDAVNYGAIGVVIGHEMTHGFDDQGRLYDKDGNMSNWWTDEDAAKFEELSSVLVKQYNEVEVLPGEHANGVMTLGENIADHGGVSIAYTAFRNTLGGVEPEPIDGLSADQRFFLGFAHVWAANITDEEIAHRTNTDVHSLGVNRVNVTLRNFQSFFDAFGIKEGDPMWRPEAERVSIW